MERHSSERELVKFSIRTYPRSIVSSAGEAHRLFNPNDLMDVLKTVRCLHAIGKLADVSMLDFPSSWRAVPENYHKFRELKLLGFVAKIMCTAVVGHDGDIEQEGKHLSISGYLTNLSGSFIVPDLPSAENRLHPCSELSKLAGDDQEHVHFPHSSQSQWGHQVLLVSTNQQAHRRVF